MVCYGSVICISALIVRSFVKTNDPAFSFPAGCMLMLVIVLGLVYAAGDYFFVGAYTHGGDILTVSSIVLLLPVFASLLKFVLTKNYPNLWQIFGYLLASAAVMLIAKGSVIR